MVEGDGEAWLLAPLPTVTLASAEFKCEAFEADDEEAWWSLEKERAEGGVASLLLTACTEATTAAAEEEAAALELTCEA